MFEGVEVGCCLGQLENCVCSDDERVLHAYADGRYTRRMSLEQRRWCIEEADSSGEGFYTREELENKPDRNLAQAVLHAWKMYVDSHL